MSTPPTPTPTYTILVADDEHHIRLVVSQRLREAGFNVIEARDGEEALELAQSNPPHLVITDFQMPLLSGLELCMALRARKATANVPAIMLTARGHAVKPDNLSQTNIKELMSKPFSARELLVKVQRVLGLPENGKANIAA
jgi:two-component system phosphate regulon response regulator PhoB